LRRTAAVRATCAASPEATASAICLTPLLPMPAPATLRAMSVIEPNRPIRPMPAGPSSTAITLVRTMPTATLTTVAAPISVVDLRISR
jgi:hypothetical protein